MVTLEALRTRLLEVADLARDQHINNEIDAYAASRERVEAVLEQLRECYKRDPAPFDAKFLEDIRTAKVCARIVTRSDLDREVIHNAHAAFLQARGLVNRGTRLGMGPRRITHCYNCKHDLDNALDVECAACGWIICGCGACGCGFVSTV